MARGEAAKEKANTQGYQDALTEFEAAMKAAPHWPEPYYKQGLMHSKLNDRESALKCYKKYLLLAPRASNAAAVRDEVEKLQYTKEKNVGKPLLVGYWIDAAAERMKDRAYYLECESDGNQVAESFSGDSKWAAEKGAKWLKNFRGEWEVVSTSGKKRIVMVNNFANLVLDTRNNAVEKRGDNVAREDQFKGGDRILKINSAEVKFKNNGEFSRFLSRFPKGRAVTFTVEREGEIASVDIVVQKP